MEPQDPHQQLRKKLSETIERSAQLLSTNKHYQFAQKIKMLAQRKSATNKLIEAEILLELAIKKMMSSENLDLNAMHDLIIPLIELYETNKDLWEPEKAKKLYSLLTRKPNEKNILYFSRIINKLGSPENVPEMVEYIVNHFEKKEDFIKAQGLVAKMQLSRATKFLQRWSQKLDHDERTIVSVRMSLLRGYYQGSFDESLVILSLVDCLDPFAKFAKFLILSVQMRSRKSYEKIGESYRKFLDSDSFFDEIYDNYGVKFFKKEKGGNQLLNLLQK